MRITNVKPSPWHVELYRTTEHYAYVVKTIECETHEQAISIARRARRTHQDLIEIRGYAEPYLEELTQDPGYFRWRRSDESEVDDSWEDA